MHAHHVAPCALPSRGELYRRKTLFLDDFPIFFYPNETWTHPPSFNFFGIFWISLTLQSPLLHSRKSRFHYWVGCTISVTARFFPSALQVATSQFHSKMPSKLSQEGNHFPSDTVFCPGFQKGRVPSEKGTLARWTDSQKGTLARWTDRQKGTLARWTEGKGHN